MAVSTMNPGKSILARALSCRGRTVVLDGEPKMAGILNVTDDSFFDGGRHATVDEALAQAVRMVEEGAAMIDVGGQSTRPGFQEVSPEVEIARVQPVIQELAGRVAVPVSVDTYKPAVARAALAAGAHVLNDIHGFQRDPELAGLAADAGCGVILMHHDSHFRETAGDEIGRIEAYFERSLQIARDAGVASDRIVLDPGIGFGKTHEQNLLVLARLGELRALGFPLLLGASRKSVIGNVLDVTADERLEGTLATTVLAVWQRVEFLRVHDVRANLRAARMAAAIARRRADFSP